MFASSYNQVRWLRHLLKRVKALPESHGAKRETRRPMKRVITSALNPEGSILRSQFAKKLLVQLGTFVSLTIVCLALWILHHTLHEIRLSDVVQHLKALSAPSVILAFAITATSYFVVTGYDVLALHHIYRPLPYSRAALASFLASAFGNNIGFGLVTGGFLPGPTYSSVGLSALEALWHKSSRRGEIS